MTTTSEQDELFKKHGWKKVSGYRIDKDELPDNVTYVKNIQDVGEQLEYYAHDDEDFAIEDPDELENHILENCECSDCNIKREDNEHNA